MRNRGHRDTPQQKRQQAALKRLGGTTGHVTLDGHKVPVKALANGIIVGVGKKYAHVRIDPLTL